MLTNRPLHTENTNAYFLRLIVKISDHAFANKERLAGSDILEVTPIKQVNMLVIRALYDKWQKEINQLRSPYFDYENSEVKAALKDFMNLLSKHISVKRPEFEALLQIALQQTFQLVFTPAAFFQREIDLLTRPTVQISALKELGRYLVINKILLTDVVEDMESRQLTEMYAGELIRHFHKAIHDNSLRLLQPEDFVIELSAILPVSIQELTGVAELEKISELPLSKNESFFDEVLAESAIVPESIVVTTEMSFGELEALQAEGAEVIEMLRADLEGGLDPEKVEGEIPVVQENELEQIEETPNNLFPIDEPNTALEERAEEHIITTETNAEHFAEQDEELGEVLTLFNHKAAEPESALTNNLTESDAPLLKDALQQSQEAPSLLEMLKLKQEVPSFLTSENNKAINSLKQNIKVNDRYKFRSQLFGNDDIAWEKALETLDAANSRHEAVDMVLKTWAPKFNWDFNNATTQAFMDIIHRRFQAE